jgi:hypothetical protein
MFFMRLRRHARWMFVLLAAIFALSFAFLGVGSGSTGIGDLMNGNLPFVGNGSSTPNVIKDAQKKLKKAEKAPGKQGLAAALLELARAQKAKSTSTEAEATYLRYLALKPKDPEARQELANEYKDDAAAKYDLLTGVANDVALSAPFGTTVLGTDPIQAAVHQDAVQKATEIYTDFRSAKAKEMRALVLAASVAKGLNRAALLEGIGTEGSDAITTAYTFSRYVPESPSAADAGADAKSWGTLALNAYQDLLLLHKHDELTKPIQDRIVQLKPIVGLASAPGR